jgi:hypothetical protein
MKGRLLALEGWCDPAQQGKSVNGRILDCPVSGLVTTFQQN